MNIQIREEYPEAVRRIIIKYLSEQKQNGKRIEDINPWEVLEESRIYLAETVAQKTSYPFGIEGGTGGLLVIEQELNNIYGDAYLQYIKKTSRETKVDDILQRRADNFVLEIKDEMHITKDMDFELLFKMWLIVIENYKKYLMLELIRNDDVNTVETRSKDDLAQYLKRAFDKIFS